jgi:hypothetical protein
MYNTIWAIRACTWLYRRWTYTKITIVSPFTNKYGKISTIIVFVTPIIFPWEEDGSFLGRSGSRALIYL